MSAIDIMQRQIQTLRQTRALLLPSVLSVQVNFALPL